MSSATAERSLALAARAARRCRVERALHLGRRRRLARVGKAPQQARARRGARAPPAAARRRCRARPTRCRSGRSRVSKSVEAVCRHDAHHATHRRRMPHLEDLAPAANRLARLEKISRVPFVGGSLQTQRDPGWSLPSNRFPRQGGPMGLLPSRWRRLSRDPALGVGVALLLALAPDALAQPAPDLDSDGIADAADNCRPTPIPTRRTATAAARATSAIPTRSTPCSSGSRRRAATTTPARRTSG